jgi:hypothetical protein
VTSSPRDNVIFEAGLFTAVLGAERTFYVVDKGGTKIPSDWAGLGYTAFDNTETRPRDKVYEAIRAIRQQIAKWQPLESLGPLAAFAGQWWQFVVNAEVKSVLGLMEIGATEPMTPMLFGTSWSADGELSARYRSLSARYDESNRKLYYSWEGEHPREQGIPRYFGLGEITFHAATSEGRSGGEGWFLSSSSSNVTDAVAKSTVYVRASSEELTILYGTAREKRASLLQAKLVVRKQLDA